MGAIFTPASNNVARITAGGLVCAVVLGVAALLGYPFTPWSTGQAEQPLQPIQFDHRHHVRDDGIDCRYCHAEVEVSAYAGVPATEVCMGCHAQIWTASPDLELVRQSWFEREPIRWVRVNDVPDFVFFNHAIHVNKGVGCETCHGRVDRMAVVEQYAPLTMSWCLDCHREPAKHLRPLDQITTMGWKPKGDRAALAAKLMLELDVHPTTNCTTCHR